MDTVERTLAECRIRPATWDDAEALSQMRAVAGWAVEFTVRALEEMELGRRAICIAEVDGRPAGSVQAVWDIEDPDLADGRRVAHLSDLVVLPPHRRHGIARRLAEHVEQLARARGHAVMTLHVDEDRPATQRLYESWGYTYYAQSISAWGTWLNGMRKAL